MANLISAAILVLFLYGRSLHSTNNPLHRKLMVTAFVADLILVLSLVVFREALTKVNTEMSWPLMVHVPIAVLTVVIYAITVYFGYRLYKGAPVRRQLRIMDRILVPARVLTLFTSLMVEYLK